MATVLEHAGVAKLVVWGGSLALCGGFTSVNGTSVPGIATWNGSWGTSIPAPGGPSDNTSDLGVDGSGNLLAAGNFSGHVKRLASGSWSLVGSGLDDAPTAFLPYGSDLVIGGGFRNALGATKPLDGIVRWDGSNWKKMGSGVTNLSGSGFSILEGFVRAITAYSGSVYVGGDFIGAACDTVNCIAGWNGSAWSALSGGVSRTGATPSVRAAAVCNGKLVIGGDFTSVGGTTAHNIAAWNGSSWSTLGSSSNEGLNSTVYALAVDGSNNLFVGGSFSATSGGTTTLNRIAEWNGSSWTSLGTMGIGGDYVYSLAYGGGSLYAGGTFTTAGGVTANYIAKWNGGTSWSALGTGGGNGTNGYVRAIVYYNSALYAGGDFDQAGGATVHHIAKWNGSWSALNHGVSGTSATVNALAVYHGYLVAAGVFTQADSAGTAVAVNNVARWSGAATWNSCGVSWGAFTGSTSGVTDGAVGALGVDGDQLYVGGEQRTTDGYLVNYLSLYQEPTNDATPPDAVSDLTCGGRGVHTTTVSYTETGDDGSVGTANSFNLHWGTNRILTESDFLSAGSWPTPSPSGPGTTHCIDISFLDPGTKYYFRMEVTDDACNVSALSNLDSVTTRSSGSIEVTCGDSFMAWGDPADELQLNKVSPNPARSQFTVEAWFTKAEIGTPFTLALYDVSGRMVSSLAQGMVQDNSYVFAGDIRRLAPDIGAGMYFVRLRAGGKVLTRSVILVK